MLCDFERRKSESILRTASPFERAKTLYPFIFSCNAQAENVGQKDVS